MNAAATKSSGIAISPKVYARRFGDEVVLLDFAVGEYFGLDAIGAFVWDGLERGEPLVSIATAVSQIYDVSADDALGDVAALVDELEARSLVTRRPA